MESLSYMSYVRGYGLKHLKCKKSKSITYANSVKVEPEIIKVKHGKYGAILIISHSNLE